MAVEHGAIALVLRAGLPGAPRRCEVWRGAGGRPSLSEVPAQLNSQNLARPCWRYVPVEHPGLVSRAAEKKQERLQASE
jgi:hypothetical protein